MLRQLDAELDFSIFFNHIKTIYSELLIPWKLKRPHLFSPVAVFETLVPKQYFMILMYLSVIKYDYVFLCVFCPDTTFCEGATVNFRDMKCKKPITMCY